MGWEFGEFRLEKFVIICDSRTGSNLLCGMLNQHPHVACHYEAF